MEEEEREEEEVVVDEEEREEEEFISKNDGRLAANDGVSPGPSAKPLYLANSPSTLPR